MRAGLRVAGRGDRDRSAHSLGVDTAGDPIRVGIVLRDQDFSAWSGRLSELAAQAVAAGIDHLTVGDHVSFAAGTGRMPDPSGCLLPAHPAVSVQTDVDLLALRHPAIVARQLATIAQLAPGRFTFGASVGGDDPSDLELCGINRGERGAGATEALRCVRLFMSGDEAGRTPRCPAPGSSGIAGSRCGSRRIDSRTQSTASRPRPARRGEAASGWQHAPPALRRVRQSPVYRAGSG